VFLKPVTALSGPLAPIVVPRCAQPVEKHQPDLEVELVAVLGRPARDVSEAEALDYVLGYTAGNDVSFRHHQFNVSQWDYSKGFGESGGGGAWRRLTSEQTTRRRSGRASSRRTRSRTRRTSRCTRR
jgi:2-keto-4-pentenoate hydratase/2-oxohepta-3-ene-1,7-dioic acid hydratase in catechol pathway